MDHGHGPRLGLWPIFGKGSANIVEFDGPKASARIGALGALSYFQVRILRTVDTVKMRSDDSLGAVILEGPMEALYAFAESFGAQGHPSARLEVEAAEFRTAKTQRKRKTTDTQEETRSTAESSQLAEEQEDSDSSSEPDDSTVAEQTAEQSDSVGSDSGTEAGSLAVPPEAAEAETVRSESADGSSTHSSDEEI